MSAAAVRDVWRSLEPRGQLTFVASGLAVVATLALLFLFASRPTYTTLASRLDPADAGEVTQALEEAGIGYQLRAGGTEVAVEDGRSADARIALAKTGLPRGGHVGFELFDEKSLGASTFQQQVNYQRALEGEVARTIEQIEGIDRAQVQLVLPEEALFADEERQASAAVLLSGSGVDGATVRGVAHLVASSVEGLDAANVTITDDRGSLLWPDGDAAVGGAGASSRRRSEQLYAAQLSAQINAMLGSTLGPEKAQARVRADLDLDARTIDRVTYAKKGTPLQVQSDEESLQSKGGGAGGAAGTGSNVPTYAAPAGGGGQSNYEHTASSTSFGVNKTVERTVVAPGAVRRLDVALLVDPTVPAAQVSALEDSVKSLAGFDEERGDTMAVSTVTFAKPAERPADGASPIPNPIALAKWVALALATLMFAFFVRRALTRRESEPSVPEPTWLREIQGAFPIAQLETASGRAALEAGERKNGLKTEVEELAKAQPEQIAAQVGAWLKD